MLDDISFVIFVENDFNGDGFPDVVFEHPDGFLGVWFMNKGAGFAFSKLLQSGRFSRPALAHCWNRGF